MEGNAPRRKRIEKSLLFILWTFLLVHLILDIIINSLSVSLILNVVSVWSAEWLAELLFYAKDLKINISYITKHHLSVVCTAPPVRLVLSISHYHSTAAVVCGRCWGKFCDSWGERRWPSPTHALVVHPSLSLNLLTRNKLVEPAHSQEPTFYPIRHISVDSPPAAISSRLSESFALLCPLCTRAAYCWERAKQGEHITRILSGPFKIHQPGRQSTSGQDNYEYVHTNVCIFVAWQTKPTLFRGRTFYGECNNNSGGRQRQSVGAKQEEDTASNYASDADEPWPIFKWFCYFENEY